MRRRLVPAVVLALLGACVARPEPLVLDPPRPVRHVGEDRGFDALHYDLRLEVPGDRPRFRGETLIRLRATRPVSVLVLDAADLRLLDAGVRTVAAVRPGHDVATSEELLAGAAVRGPRLELALTRPLEAGEEAEVRVAYAVERPLAGLHFSLPSETGVADAIPQVYSQGEAERARYWFPCHDDPADRATHTLTATVPLSWTVVAAGRKEADVEDAASATRTVSWSLDVPMPTYLFTFAAGPFVSVNDVWEDVPLSHWVEPRTVTAAAASFASTPDVLGFFSDYTGFRYPFAKYAHVAVRDFPFGGMENVSATTVTRLSVRPPEELPYRPAWGLVAHEAAHQWFGDVVTCRSWPHVWLNEGFATYFGQLYRRHAFGEDAFLYAMGGTIDAYTRACRGDGLRPLVKEEYRLPMDLFFDGTVYPGGASRLQLLRGELGEVVFRRGIGLYLERNAYRSVTTEAFRAAMEEASGRDLGDWFAQWVYAPGYPELDVTWRLDDGEVVLHVSQVQDPALGIPAAFTFPLDVRWWEGDAWREGRYRVDEREEELRFPVGPGFRGFLELDPYVYLPARWTVHESPEATRARALHAGSPRVRALACRDLAAAGGLAAIGVLWEVARNDELPEVRAEAVRLLARSLLPDDEPRLHAGWAAEPDPVVKAAWWPAFASHARSDWAADEVEARLHDPAAPIVERVAALPAWARLHDGDPGLRAALTDLAVDPTVHRELRVTAITTLARRFPDRDTHRALLPLSWAGTETPIRSAALRALEPELDGDADDPFVLSVVDSFRQALTSSSAVLRRTVATACAKRPHWFRAEVEDLLRREPDARIRRSLEAEG